MTFPGLTVVIIWCVFLYLVAIQGLIVRYVTVKKTKRSPEDTSKRYIKSNKGKRRDP